MVETDTLSLLKERDWTKVINEYNNSSAPFEYVVLDDFLSDGIAIDLQKKLVNHWGWHYRYVNRGHLHNNKPKINEINKIIEELSVSISELLENYNYTHHWSIMNHGNTEALIHADNADLVVSIWLTPDEFNLDPETGGLILYDVRKPYRIMEDFSVKEFLEENTLGVRKRIPYRFNRAVIFNPLTLHQTDTVKFSEDRGTNHRINLSISYVKK